MLARLAYQMFYIPTFGFVIILLSMMACSSDSGNSSGALASITITLSETHSEPVQVDEEVVPQNNCGGTADAENEISRSRSVAHIIETSSELTVNAEGEVKIFGTGINLGASVANQLGYSYGRSENISRAVVVRAAPGKKMEHIISHQEIWKVGKATVWVNNQKQDIPYRFRSDFALILLESKEIPDCGFLPTPIPVFSPIPTLLTSTPIPPTVQDIPPTVPSVNCSIGVPLPHRSPVVGQPWVLPNGGWIIVNFWSNEPGIDQTEHKLLLSPTDPRSFLGGGSAWQWPEECEAVARQNYNTNILRSITLEELRTQNLVR